MEDNSQSQSPLDGALACAGGPPLRSQPFPAWPVFDEEMIEAAADVLRSGRVNAWTGDQTQRFEQEFAEFVDARHAVATANGTLALELALQALGIGPGDEVIVPSRTFIASASCAVMRGAKPVIADIDPISQNLTSQTIQDVLSPRTKAIIAVHLAGLPCDMDPILQLAARYGVKVIEDCAQAHGATYKGRPVGSLADAAAFSFCQDKTMTTGGEGGMLTTNDRALWQRAWSYKDHGKSWDAVHRKSTGEVFRWLHEDFGTNWRMTEMQAAIGRVMLRRLPQWIMTRRQNASLLDGGLSNIPAIRIARPSPEFAHSYYKYYAFLRPNMLHHQWSRDRIVLALQAEGIPCGSGACPEIYQEKAFITANARPPAPLAAARRLGETSLMFLVHPTLGETEMKETCSAVEKVMRHAAPANATAHPRAA